ncbi:hypothetical protein NE237_031278 [Protea cynaroides]|uniref:Uncharacterized protein n=1 Tax=Protea cynaroides TaxID=273540 RepID=A0A9Q0L184_9MAGN|nr:hypothetical protein NE237_031278 [Protea cynaroides]
MREPPIGDSVTADQFRLFFSNDVAAGLFFSTGDGNLIIGRLLDASLDDERLLELIPDGQPGHDSFDGRRSEHCELLLCSSNTRFLATLSSEGAPIIHCKCNLVGKPWVPCLVRLNPMGWGLMGGTRLMPCKAV